jgi:hypothetical protein
MNKIPSAKEFAESNQYGLEEYDEGGYLGINTKYFADKLIEFAKLHVQACKEDIIQNATTKRDWYQSNDCPDGFWSEIVNEDSILNAYPLDKII